MNFKNLSARLIDNEPDNWPDGFQELGSMPEMPEHINDKVTKKINAARENESQLHSSKKPTINTNRFRIYGIAATVLITSALALFVYLNQSQAQKYAGSITILSGTLDLIENFETESTNNVRSHVLELSASTLPKSGHPFLFGSKLTTHKNSSAQLLFENGIKTRIGSNSQILLQKKLNLDPDQNDLKPAHLQLHLSGILYYQSGRLPNRSKFSIRTKTAIAAVRGTEFLLDSKTSLTKLIVYNGQVEIVALTKKNQMIVKSGQKAIVDSKGNIVISKIGISERALQTKYNRSDSIFSKYGTGALNFELDLNSIDAIKKHYGKLYLVILKDGREYTGYPSLHNGLVQVHTTYGVIEVEKKDVASLNELE